MNLQQLRLDSIPKYIYALSIFFFLGSLWYEWLYFESFGVNIFHYMSLSESLSNFIDKIPTLLLISIGSLLYPLVLQLFFHKKFERMYQTTKLNKRIRTSQFNKSMALMTFVFLLPLMSFMVFVPTLFHSFARSQDYIWIRMFVVTFDLYLFIAIPLIYTKSKYSDSYEYKTPIILIAILNFYIVIFYYNKIQILDIIEPQKAWYDKTSWSVKLTNEESIKSSDTTYFLAKTNDFLFILYPKPLGMQSKTRIIKVDDVKEMNVIKYVRWHSIFP